MNQGNRIWNMAEFGDPSEVRSAIDSNISLIDQHLEFIRVDLDTTKRNFVLYNLLRKVRLYVHCLMSSLSGPIDQIGFLTRSLFELNLITRYVLMDEGNLERFFAETVVDRIQVLKDWVEWRDISSEEDARRLRDIGDLEEEIEKSKARLKELNLPYKKPNSILTKAKMVGLEPEYKALYKLFSKYVHPSAYTINESSQEVGSDEMRNIFLAYAQVYASDTFHRLKEATINGVV